MQEKEMEGIKICSNSIQTILFLLIILVASFWLSIEAAATCRPSGRTRGKCEHGKAYTTYKCSPQVSHRTKAILTLNSFEKGGSGGGASDCDNKFHSDNTPVVALSTGWFNNKKRCMNNIIIHANGRSVKAKVVDECDSTKGCDAEHDFQPPCMNNVVDASQAVWKALGVPKKDWGQLDIFWSDA